MQMVLWVFFHKTIYLFTTVNMWLLVVRFPFTLAIFRVNYLEFFVYVFATFVTDHFFQCTQFHIVTTIAASRAFSVR